MTTFTLLVFLAAYCFMLALFTGMTQDVRQKRNTLREKLARMDMYNDTRSSVSLLKQRYAPRSVLEKLATNLPGTSYVEGFIRQAGHHYPVHRVVLFMLLLMVSSATITWILSRNIYWTLIMAPVIGLLPLLKLKRDEQQRLLLFETQLPDALDTMIRALRTGYPFVETLEVIAQEMSEPLAGEFAITSDEINHGVDLRQAMQNLSDRVHCLPLTAVTTAVMIQRETGGNLTEILERISKIIRNRFRFQRRIKTLSAEGRMSAWILGLIPFVLFALISLTTPEYTQTLLTDPMGKNLVNGALVLLLLGNIWVMKLLRIEP